MTSGLAQSRVRDGDAPAFRHVLIVEDEPRIRKRLAAVFRARGAQVLQATTVAEALPLLEPVLDLLVVDVRLPDGSGRAIVEACALLDRTPLILATSGIASAREAFELAQLGVDIFLPKPFSVDALEARLEGVTGRDTLRRAPLREFSAETSALLAERLRAFADARGLSDAEQNIIRLALSGLPRRHFAETLGVTENTCKTRIRRLLRKCDAPRLADVPRLLLLRVPHG